MIPYRKNRKHYQVVYSLIMIMAAAGKDQTEVISESGLLKLLKKIEGEILWPQKITDTP